MKRTDFQRSKNIAPGVESGQPISQESFGGKSLVGDFHRVQAEPQSVCLGVTIAEWTSSQEKSTFTRDRKGYSDFGSALKAGMKVSR
jgi:hypothetical protein